MQTIKALSLVVLPALLLSGEAAARDDSQSGPAASRCWETDCKLATNGPELTGARTASGRATVSAVRLPGRRPPAGIGGSCPPFAGGADSNGPELSGTRAGVRATVAAVRLPGRRPPGIGGSCPPFACGSDGNGPELTGARAGSGRATASAVRLGHRPPADVGGSCPAWACGSDSNGPELTGLAKPVVLDPVPPPPSGPLPVPYPNASSMWCWQVTDWYEICW